MPPLFDEEMDITKNARTIEWLKSELASAVAALYRALLGDKDEPVLDALSSIIVATYVLAHRLGISFSRLERRVIHKLKVNIDENHQVEEWYGELSLLKDHFEGER